jgi:hypothetical protein
MFAHILSANLALRFKNVCVCATLALLPRPPRVRVCPVNLRYFSLFNNELRGHLIFLKAEDIFQPEELAALCSITLDTIEVPSFPVRVSN